MAGSSGFASWFGKVPSSSKYSSSIRSGRSVEHGGHGVPGHPVAGVDDHVQRADRGQVDQRSVRYSAYAASRSCSRTVPGTLGDPERLAVEQCLRVVADLAPGPMSRLIGTAPGRQVLIPLYVAGLCEAVNIAPGRFSTPEAKYSRSVEAEAGHHDVDAGRGDTLGERAGEFGRRLAHVVRDDDALPATSARSAKKCANAWPRARLTCEVSCSPTSPRMS